MNVFMHKKRWMPFIKNNEHGTVFKELLKDDKELKPSYRMRKELFNEEIGKSANGAGRFINNTEKFCILSKLGTIICSRHG